MAGPLLELSAVPLWVLWLLALIGMGVTAAVTLWMLAPAVRPQQARTLGLVFVLFVIFVVVGGNSRPVLWFSGGGFLLAAVPLLWMGRLPVDMPGARDPRVVNHPRYPQVVRRGRIAGVGLVVLEIAWIVLSVIYVGGTS